MAKTNEALKAYGRRKIGKAGARKILNVAKRRARLKHSIETHLHVVKRANGDETLLKDALLRFAASILDQAEDGLDTLTILNVSKEVVFPLYKMDPAMLARFSITPLVAGAGYSHHRKKKEV